MAVSIDSWENLENWDGGWTIIPFNCSTTSPKVSECVFLNFHILNSVYGSENQSFRSFLCLGKWSEAYWDFLPESAKSDRFLSSLPWSVISLCVSWLCYISVCIGRSVRVFEKPEWQGPNWPCLNISVSKNLSLRSHYQIENAESFQGKTFFSD